MQKPEILEWLSPVDVDEMTDSEVVEMVRRYRWPVEEADMQLDIGIRGGADVDPNAVLYGRVQPRPFANQTAASDSTAQQDKHCRFLAPSHR
jgi:hypothetical protein